MKASIVDLRRRMADVLRALDRNEPVKILYRGKEKAVLVPANRMTTQTGPVAEHPAFGMWKDRLDNEDVLACVRRMREGRILDS